MELDSGSDGRGGSGVSQPRLSRHCNQLLQKPPTVFARRPVVYEIGRRARLAARHQSPLRDAGPRPGSCLPRNEWLINCSAFFGTASASHCTRLRRKHSPSGAASLCRSGPGGGGSRELTSHEWRNTRFRERLGSGTNHLSNSSLYLMIRP